MIIQKTIVMLLIMNFFQLFRAMEAEAPELTCHTDFLKKFTAAAVSWSQNLLTLIICNAKKIAF